MHLDSDRAWAACGPAVRSGPSQAAGGRAGLPSLGAEREGIRERARSLRSSDILMLSKMQEGRLSESRRKGGRETDKDRLYEWGSINAKFIGGYQSELLPKLLQR